MYSEQHSCITGCMFKGLLVQMTKTRFAGHVGWDGVGWDGIKWDGVGWGGRGHEGWDRL